MRATRKRWLLIGLSVGALSGCSCGDEERRAAAGEDEATLRAEHGIPESATLVALDVDPREGGTFGREGLRVVGRFRLPEDSGDEPLRSAGWVETEPDLGRLRYLPPGLPPRPTNGLWRCVVGVWVTGQEFTPVPCERAPERFDRYRVAVLDRDTREIVAISKNYF